MFWLSAKRVWRGGIQSFFRNGLVSLSSVIIMTITLFIISSVFILNGLLDFGVSQIKEKVDISVYFITNASEEKVLDVKKSLEVLPEVSKVEYISREQALENFKEKNKGDELTLQALAQLDENPLGASLNIKAKDPSQYEGIANFLNSDSNELLSASSTKIIDSVNYSKNKLIITRASRILDSINTVGLALAILFIIISVIIVFNTIRLSIYMSRDEISVMHLVGASTKFIKGPFVVSGMFCGIISAFLVVTFFAISTYLVTKYYGNYLVGFDLFSYYMGNFFQILGVLFGSGIVLGGLASYLAVHKYLKN